MKYLSRKILASLIVIPLLGSCGKSGDGGGKGSQDETHDEGTTDGSTIDGLYQATFTTLNPHVNGTLPGSFTFKRDGDRVITYVRLFAGKPRAWHQQAIYLGKRCPDLRDDKNSDGFIDIEEAMAVTGKVIIPLDANMNSQAAGRSFYPLGDLSGYYHYERVSSFNRMFDDLKDEDSDPNDHVAKLGPDDKFTVVNKVVMIQGVTEDTILPESVVGLERRRNFQTLPIACGVIKKVEKTPGVPDDGVIPGPVAEVDPNQDRPAPEDNWGEQGGTVAGTTGTNDTNDGEVGDEGGTAGGGTTGGETSGGTSTGGRTTSGRTSGETSGGTTGRTSGGTSGRTIGGFIGGFIGGSSGGRTQGTSGGGGNTTGGSSSGSTTGGTSGRTIGGFIGGFIGGSSGGSSTSGSTTGSSTTGGTTGE